MPSNRIYGIFENIAFTVCLMTLYSIELLEILFKEFTRSFTENTLHLLNCKDETKIIFSTKIYIQSLRHLVFSF